jgi:hypothetical protein
LEEKNPPCPKYNFQPRCMVLPRDYFSVDPDLKVLLVLASFSAAQRDRAGRPEAERVRLCPVKIPIIQFSAGHTGPNRR